MKTLVRSTLMIALITLVLATTLVQAQDRPRADATPSGPLPDLIIKSVHVLDNFRVQVIVANDSEGKLLRNFLVHLRIYDGEGQLLKTIWRIGKPPLGKGVSLILQFETNGQTLLGNRFEVEVDVGNGNAESNENNNRTRRTDGPGANAQTEKQPASNSAKVDLAAINVFPATAGKKNVIQGVIRNLGDEPYSGFRGKRQATITLTVRKDGEESEQTLGTAKVPDISAGGQQVIAFPSPPEFAHADGYRLTLVVSSGDNNAANDSKINTSTGFSSAGGTSSADLEAAEVKKTLADGTARVKGLVRNVSSQHYQGEREVRLYFVDQSGNEEKSTLIVSRSIKSLAAGKTWEISGDLPASLRKVQHFLLRLSISAGDDNKGNDEKTRPFGNL